MRLLIAFDLNFKQKALKLLQNVGGLRLEVSSDTHSVLRSKK